MGLGALVSELARAIGFSRLRVTCRRDLKILKKWKFLARNFKKGPSLQRKADQDRWAWTGTAGAARYGIVYDDQLLVYSDEKPVIEASANLGDWHPSRSRYWGTQDHADKLCLQSNG